MNADNLVVLNGRLTKDVDLRQNQKGDSYGLFTVAVNRTYKDANGDRPADFHSCVANGKQAEIVAQYFKKGDMIGIVGELRDNNYMKDGVQQYAKQIKVDSFGFRNSNNASDQNQTNTGQKNNYQGHPQGNAGQKPGNTGQQFNAPNNATFNTYADAPDIKDDDLPF